METSLTTAIVAVTSLILVRLSLTVTRRFTSDVCGSFMHSLTLYTGAYSHVEVQLALTLCNSLNSTITEMSLSYL